MTVEIATPWIPSLKTITKIRSPILFKMAETPRKINGDLESPIALNVEAKKL